MSLEAPPPPTTTTAGRIRRKRKSDRISSSAVSAPSTSSTSSADAADVWGEVEEQIERTLREGRIAGEVGGPREGRGGPSLKSLDGSSASPHLLSPPSLALLSHSQSLPLLRSSLSPLLSSVSPVHPSGASSLCFSPDWSDTSSAFSPSPSLASFSPSSAFSSSSPPPSSWPSSVCAVGPPTVYPDSRELLDPSRLHALVRRRSEGRISLLTALNADVLLRCLGFLDLSDLCALPPVSRQLRELSEDFTIWSLLFSHRWPVQRAREEGKDRWKAEYRAREVQERQHFFLSLAHQPQGEEGEAEAEALQAEWRRLYAAQRTRDRSRRRVSEFEVIRRWKESNADDSAAAALHGSRCSFTRCRLVQLTADLYICTASHAVHHCSANCLNREGESDGRCPVSGRWPSALDASMLQIAEAEGEDDEDGGGQGEDAGAGDYPAGQEAFDADGLCPLSSFIRGYEDGDGGWAAGDDEAGGRRYEDEEDEEKEEEEVEDEAGGQAERHAPDERGTALQRTRRLASAERKRRSATVYSYVDT